MHERSIRCNKNLFLDSHSCHSVSKENDSKSRIVKMQVESILKQSMHFMHQFPYIKDFSVFELYCNNIGVERAHVRVLWETMSSIQVYEISVGLIRKQIQSLYSVANTGHYRIMQMKTLRICLFCCQFNTPPLFRYDPRRNVVHCNKCEIKDSIVEIEMIGRIVVVAGIHLILDPNSNEIVVFAGLMDNIPQIKWNSIKHINPLRLAMAQTSILQVVCNKTMNNNLIPSATHDFIRVRRNGCKYVHNLNYETGTRCVFCRSTTIVQSSSILDIYNMQLVNVSVCSKHKIPEYTMKTNFMNINTYVNIVVHRVSNYRGVKNRV